MKLLQHNNGVIEEVEVASVAMDKATAYLTVANNTVANAWGKIPLDTSPFDTGGMWDDTNKRFTPTKPGYYQCNIRARTNIAGSMVVGVGKNGAIFKTCGADGSLIASGGSALIYCNGTTDYLELFVYTTAVRAITTGRVDTYMDVFGPF